MNVQRILFPTDFSPCSEIALDHALFHAEINDAELHIAHCITWNDRENQSPAHMPDADTIMLHMQKVARVQMEETLDPHQEKPFKIKEKLLTGPRPAETILDYVKHEEIDMVVMGTHGRQGLYYFLMGSTAEEVVRLAPCPVLTVREHGEYASLHMIRKILVPVDFSDASRRALVRAKYMASLHGAELLALHVLRKLDFPVGGLDAGFTFINEWLPKVKDEQMGRLETILKETKGPDVPCKGMIDVGNPARDIVHAAKIQRADLIVMPTHGHTGFDRLIMGSTAERVLRMASCPVYTEKFKD
ncbi:MAG: universal stress protein [Acidobacteriota bacterium]|nr:universal stress protein [Acidobacteriota bacterium]